MLGNCWWFAQGILFPADTHCVASDDMDDPGGAVGIQAGTGTPPRLPEPALPRLNLDDLRLRLEMPLFSRDPGLTPSPHVPQSVSLPEPEPEDVAEPEPEHERVDVAEVASTDGSLTMDEAFLHIVEPPPVAREADPVVSGLAELIARGIPPVAPPVVEVEPVAVEPVALEPVALEPVVPEPVAPEPVPVAPEPVADVTRLQTVVKVDESRVAAELDRLAYVPDPVQPQVLPALVVVPEIAVSDGPVSAIPANLSLARHEVYAARASATTAAPRRSFIELAAEAAAPMRARPKRHPFRRFVVALLLLGMVAGGLYAVKFYILDTRWSAEVEPLAKEVEAARGLEFDQAVDVSTLPADDYAVELARFSLGLTDETIEQAGGEWRALGLLSGTTDVEAIGMAALADSPAFYDPASKTISVVEDLPEELMTFAMHRALTMALLDQHFGWGDRVGEGSPAVARGTRALYDADALATATSMVDDTERTDITEQLFQMYADYDIPVSPSPFASTVSGRLGVALWPYFRDLPTSERDTIETDATLTDGQVLDLRRLVAGTPETGAANSRGMLFWYHVLAARVDDDLAWRAALTWLGDDVSTVTGGAGVCVTAVFQADPATASIADAAFQQWAAAAPAQAPATVVSSATPTTHQVTVNACDPGPTVATNDGGPRLSLGGAPLRSEQFRTLLDQQPALGEPVAACAVYGADSVSIADERGIIDGLEGWTALAAHPAPDPLANGCTT